MSNINTNIRRTFILVVILFLGYMTIGKWSYVSNNPIENSYKYLNANIKKLIKKNGIQKTTLTIQDAYKSNLIDINQCHSLYHYLGHAAYEIYGVNWNSINFSKSNNCMYGYEHGVEAQIVLQEFGNHNEVFKILNDYCSSLRKQFLPAFTCYHGVGHSLIQAHLPIEKVLKSCDELVKLDNEDATDCYRGAFSEYVNNLMGIDGDTDAQIPGVIPLKIEINKTYDRCLELESKYQEACVSQFTSFIYDGDLESSLTKCNNFNSWVGEICAYKVSGAFASTNRVGLSMNTPPDFLNKLNKYIRQGYIKGVVYYYGQFHGKNFRDEASSWCNNLPVVSDKEYCKDQL